MPLVLYNMNKIYIISPNFYELEINKNNFIINKKCCLEILNNNTLLPITIKNCNNKSLFTINPSQYEPNNFYYVHETHNDTFIYLCADNFLSMLQKHKINNCDVYIYNNAVKIIHNNLCYCNAFYFEKETSVASDDDNIYVYNSKNVLIFNLQNLTFLQLNVKSYQKQDDFCEALCSVPYCINFFMLFNFNSAKLKFTKKLKNSKPLFMENLPQQLFYLCKLNFLEAQKFTTESIKALGDYFSKFEHIFEINGKCYLVSKFQICETSFNIKDNKIIDID